MTNLGSCSFVKSALEMAGCPEPLLPEMAFWGRSNVGKSSLLNKLMGRAGLARVSKFPGRTQTLNFYRCGAPFMMVDLPGYGYARVAKSLRRSWSHVVTSYLEHRPSLWRIFLLIDARHTSQAIDQEALAFLTALRRPVQVVFTKIDDVKETLLQQHIDAFMRAYPNTPLFPVSTRTGKGLQPLLESLLSVSIS